MRSSASGMPIMGTVSPSRAVATAPRALATVASAPSGAMG